MGSRMKKIFNKIDQMVVEMGTGLAMAYPGKLTFEAKYRYVCRAQRNPDKVVLISGGGSGHEPAHGGFVGTGMLDAAVCGEIFSSPSQIQVYRCIKETAGNKGTLLIIKNYSGDIMNFQNAAALAGLDGLKDLGANKGDRIALMVNGFGATPLLELYILNYYAMRELAKKGITVSRIFVGNYMTSIDMAGASISILKLDDELQKYLAAKSDAPAFKVDGTEQAAAFTHLDAEGGEDGKDISYKADLSGNANVIRGNALSLRNMVYLVDKMAEIIIENEVPFCDLDSYAGDGDFGKSIANGFRQLKNSWSTLTKDHAGSIYGFLDACSLIIMEYCGGASGPIWGFAFKHAAKIAEGKESLAVQDMAEMLASAVKGIQDVGERAFGRGAGVGDKTLMDALIPCAEAWKAGSAKPMRECFKNGAAAAIDGAEKTKDIVARMGRAGTVGERSLGYPDAGAFALGKIFTELTESLKFE